MEPNLNRTGKTKPKLFRMQPAELRTYSRVYMLPLIVELATGKMLNGAQSIFIMTVFVGSNQIDHLSSLRIYDLHICLRPAVLHVRIRDAVFSYVFLETYCGGINRIMVMS